MSNFLHVLTKEGLNEKLEAMQTNRPKAYGNLALGFTIFGYFLIAFVPLFSLIALLITIDSALDARHWSDLIGIANWLGITAITGFLSYLMIRLRVSKPTGLGLKPDKAPKLYEMLDELRQIYKHPKIHRVVIHDQFNVEFVMVPRFGLPLITENVLHIGLPVMQALTMPQFKGLIARKLGQYSMVHNKVSHIVYRFRQYMALYQLAYSKQSSGQWFYLPFKWFFRLFMPLVNIFTFQAIRKDELEADTYAMEVMNDDDFADTLIRFYVVQLFLDEKFWPKVQEMLSRNPQQPEFLPHSAMGKALRTGLTDSEFAARLDTIMKKDYGWEVALPSLTTRLDNLGYRTLRLQPPVLESAAQKLLGASFPAIVKLMDQQWMTKLGITPKKSPSKPKEPATSTTPSPLNDEQRRFNSLSAAATQRTLSDDELWQLGNLSETLQGKGAALEVYQKLLKRNPAHAKTWFEIGRILLTQQDATGVKALERAMSLDTACTPQASWILAKYYKAQGDESTAKHYIQKAGRTAAA